MAPAVIVLDASSARWNTGTAWKTILVAGLNKGGKGFYALDITNPAEVMWAVSTRWDPKTATDIIDGMWTGYIDPMLLPERRAKDDLTNSRIIIYAVRPFANASGSLPRS